MYAIGNTVYFADSTTGNDANRSVLMAYDSKLKAGLWHDTAQAKVILADGTKKTVDIDRIEGVDGLSADKDGKIVELDIGRMYLYSIDNDGDYTLYPMNETMSGRDIAGYDSYVDNNEGVQGSKVQGYMIADDAVVFALIGDNDAAVYSGKTIKDAGRADGWGDTANGGVLVEDTNGIDYARMLNIKIGEKLNEANNYAVLLSDAVRSKDDAQYIEYHLWNGSEIIDVREKTDEKREQYLFDGDVISFENDGEGMIKSVDKVNNGVDGKLAAILGYANGDIRLLGANGSNVYEVNSDTTVIYLNTNNDDDARAVPGDGYDYPATMNENDEHFINAIYVLDNNKDAIKFILIDINGELTGKTVESLTSNRFTEEQIKAAGGLEAVLADNDDIVVTDDYQLTDVDDANDNGVITIGATKSVQFLGDLDMNHQDLTVANGADVDVEDLFWIHSTFTGGTITVGSLKIGDSDNTGVVKAGSKIIVTGMTSTNGVVVDATIDDGVVVTIGGTDYVANDANNNLVAKDEGEQGGGEQGGETVNEGLDPADLTNLDSQQKITMDWYGEPSDIAEMLTKLNNDLKNRYTYSVLSEMKYSSQAGSPVTYTYTATGSDGETYTIDMNLVFQVTVVGTDGKTITAYTDENGEITMSDVADGIYMLEDPDAVSASSVVTVVHEGFNQTDFALSSGAGNKATEDVKYVPAIEVVTNSKDVKIDGKAVSDGFVAIGANLTATLTGVADEFSQLTL